MFNIMQLGLCNGVGCIKVFENHLSYVLAAQKVIIETSGQGPEEYCWLADTELTNAADVHEVQDYLDSLQQQGRPAARVGRPLNM